MVTSRSDRGQVILIGAILLAFIIVGIVVVFNGVLYAETISSSSTSQAAGDAKVSENELEQMTIDIVHKSNMDLDDTYDDPDESINEALTAYQTLKANSSATMVNGTVSEDETGEVAVGMLESGVGDDELRIEDDNVGHLNVSLDTGDEVTINTTDPTLGPEDPTLEHDGGWEYNEEPVEGVDDGEPIEADLVSGSVNGAPNALSGPLIDPSEEYGNVTVTVDTGEVSYGFVRQGGGSVESPTSISEETAVWSVDVDWTYDSNNVAFDRNTVEIYERER